MGVWYSFLPAVSSSGATLTYSIANAPRWSTFNTATGELSGTPSAQDVGSYANVTITVTDGTNTVSLPPYGITVAASPNSIALSWTPPSQNTDGTPLSNLAGFRIYYGTDPSSMTQSIDVANPHTVNFELANLTSGNWYISLVAYAADGSTSAQSGVVAVTL